MGRTSDPMMIVRAELCQRLEGLRHHLGRRNGRGLEESVESIRQLAAAYGLTPVVRIADALERTASLRGVGAALYLERMQDAIGCSTADDSASQALLASVSVHLHH